VAALIALLPLFSLIVLVAFNMARDPLNTGKLRHASTNCNDEIIVQRVAVETIVFTIALVEGRETVTADLNGSGEGLSIAAIVPLKGCSDEEDNSIQTSKLTAKGAVSEFKARNNVAACDRGLQVSGFNDP
jgi:hypothetical protein